MAIGVFPVAKLGALLIKQISKPIANTIKTNAKNHPVFRRYVCLPPARFYHWCEVKAKMWIVNLGKPVSIPVLSEAMAIELGANLLGEGIIFIIAAGILVSEYNRSANKEAAKEEAKRKEMAGVQEEIRELYLQTDEQAAYIRELRRRVGDLETRVASKPTVFSEKPKDKEPPSTPPSAPILPKHQVPFIGEAEPPSETPAITEYREVGVILRAVSDVENEFWKYPPAPRKVGIVSKALDHFYKDVYRVPLST